MPGAHSSFALRKLSGRVLLSGEQVRRAMDMLHEYAFNLKAYRRVKVQKTRKMREGSDQTNITRVGVEIWSETKEKAWRRQGRINRFGHLGANWPVRPVSDARMAHLFDITPAQARAIRSGSPVLKESVSEDRLKSRGYTPWPSRPRTCRTSRSPLPPRRLPNPKPLPRRLLLPPLLRNLPERTLRGLNLSLR